MAVNRTLDELRKGCLDGERWAQKALYNRYAPLFLTIAMRYVKDRHLAEDVLADGFIKIFSKLHTFQNTGSFEGWMKRIIVHEALMYLRKPSNLRLVQTDETVDMAILPKALENLATEDILNLIRQLPDGYRRIFNLYVIEGYKHREIAEMLDISIHTSKSQLIMAKKKLIGLIEKKMTRQNKIGS